MQLVVDPRNVIDASEVGEFGDVVEVADWFALRRAYERFGKSRSEGGPPLVLLVRTDHVREPRDLPYDIEHAAAVVRIRVPAPPDLRALVLGLDHELSDRAVGALRSNPADPLSAIVSRTWGVVLPGDHTDQVRELDALIRLRTDPSVPNALWPHVRPRLRGALALALAAEPPDLTPLQSAWEDWIARTVESPWHNLFERLGPRIGMLFHGGMLKPARAGRGELPSWARIGLSDASAVERVEELLTAAPEALPPTDAAGWIRVAAWWGELRAALAEGSPETAPLREEAWSRWLDLDQAFGGWLQKELGALMLRSAAWPLSVDKIAPFLAGRLRQAESDRVLLVVLDGASFAQLATIRGELGLDIATPGGSFAMLPTLTSISRQAIFAGALPIFFADTIRISAARIPATEEAVWRKFWQNEGLSATEARYLRTPGRSYDDVVTFGGARVVGMVVTAIDEMLHSAETLGDAQLAATVITWARHGFLRRLLEQASEEGFEIWLTADHGNIEALPLGRPQEGLAVESAGVRVRWYPNEVLRKAAVDRVEGISWDPPGLPAGVCYPLFAPGRRAYFTGGALRVAHGGQSLDEVIVPFVRIAP